MLRSKMINFALIWCCVFCVQFKTVVPAESIFKDDAMTIEGHSVHSSDIKFLLADRNVSKIYVYLTGTFHVDEDLQLNGIRELQIFASIFNITMPVTIDLSGSDGENHQESAVNGSAGYSGNNGASGGNFFGLANEIRNGDYLTVRSNGGNGGDGQDGAGSDDIYVLLSADDAYGESGWFSSGNLTNYYKNYFADRGYDAEISGVGDYTSLYAVFVHNRMANFSVRLHPKNCCGTTGIGGVGGFGGQKGKLVFNQVGSNKSQSSPRFVAFDGSFGKQGRDGRTCESLALDIGINAKLNKVVLIFIPLHHTFSSHFTVLKHTRSSKCEPLYVTKIESDSNVPNESETASSAILRYKRFLLKNMKNASHTAVAQETYKAIDKSSKINYENSLRGLLSEALELEKNYSELKDAIDVTSLYERLLDRVERVMLNWENKDDERPLSRLRFILYLKLDDVRAVVSDNNFIVNLEQFTRTVVSRIELGRQIVLPATNINDMELQNNLNQLIHNVHGNSFLDQYHQAIDLFRVIYFPFAADYLDSYRLPSSPSAYTNLNAIVSMTTSTLNALLKNIKDINSNNTTIDTTDRLEALYTWNSADIRDEIRELFEGKAISLFADIRKSKKAFNAFKFNRIDVVFRSPVQTVEDQLNNVLKAFKINLTHTGRSTFRCISHFYLIASQPTFIVSSFAKNQVAVPVSRNDVYDTLRNNHPILSPYTFWEIQLIGMDQNARLPLELAQFQERDIAIELYATGKYILENAPICENVNLGKFYTQIER